MPYYKNPCRFFIPCCEYLEMKGNGGFYGKWNLFFPERGMNMNVITLTQAAFFSCQGKSLCGMVSEHSLKSEMRRDHYHETSYGAFTQ